MTMRCLCLLLAPPLWAVIHSASYATEPVPPDTSFDLGRLQSSVERRIVFQMYWWGREGEYRQGSNRPFEIAAVDGEFIMKIEDFTTQQAGAATAYFSGQQTADNTYITEYSAKTPVAGDGEQDAEWWKLFRPAFTTPLIGDGSIHIPVDGVPVSLPATAAKERIAQSVELSLRDYLRFLRSKSLIELPQSIEVQIADFNVEDEMTYGLVLSTGAVFEISICDIANPRDPRCPRASELSVSEFVGTAPDRERLRGQIHRRGGASRIS